MQTVDVSRFEPFSGEQLTMRDVAEAERAARAALKAERVAWVKRQLRAAALRRKARPAA